MVWPWCLHGTIMVSRWTHHGVAVVNSKLHGMVFMMSPWRHHGAAMVSSNHHDGPTRSPWWARSTLASPWRHVVPITPLWCLHGGLEAPWCGHGVPWCHHGIVMVVSPHHAHGVSMAAPRCLHGGLKAPWSWCRHDAYRRATMVSLKHHGIPMASPW